MKQSSEKSKHQPYTVKGLDCLKTRPSKCRSCQFVEASLMSLFDIELTSEKELFDTHICLRCEAKISSNVKKQSEEY